MDIEGAPLPAASRSAAVDGRGPGATPCTGARAAAAHTRGAHADCGAAGVAGRARRGVHRVLGRGRSRRRRLVGVLTTGAAWGAKPHAAARYKAVMRALFLALLVLFAAAPAFAQEAEGPATPRSWQSLSPQQQQLLHNFQGNWDTLPADKQAGLARGSDRWIRMTPEERSGAQERFKTWRALPPEQRQQLRERWHQFKGLPPEQQQQIRRQFNAFRQMSPERQQALRNAWRNMSPEQRRGALEGAMPRGPAGHPGPRAAPRPVPRRPH